MINWILGGAIIIATILIIVRSIKRIKDGKSGCNCSGCDIKGNCPSKGYNQ